MTVHSTSFPTDQPVPRPAPPKRFCQRPPQRHRKCSRQKSSICASYCSPEPRSPHWPARPGMAGNTGRSAAFRFRPTMPMSRPTTRRLRRRSRAISRGARWRQRAGEGRAGAGAHRRPRFQGRARSGQGRCRRGARPPSPASRPLEPSSRSSTRPRRRSTSTRRRQTFAEQDDKRYAHLATTGYGSVQNAQQAQSRIAGAQAAIARDTAILATAHKQVDVLKAELAQAKAALAHAEAVQQPGRAQSLLYDDRRAGRRRRRQPHAARRPVCPGRNAADGGRAGRGAYIVANYKETQLTDVRPGQAVEIEVDMFPGQSCTAMSTASRRQAARNSRCCRPTTPPAISPRSCSASR